MLIANGQLSLAEFEALTGKHFGHCKDPLHEVILGYSACVECLIANFVCLPLNCTG